MSDRERETSEVRPEEPGKTENFWSRNVRTVTFLVCIAVFLALFGPVSVFTIRRVAGSENRGKNMTAEEAIRLSQSAGSVTFEKLREYRGRYNETESVEVYYIDFESYQILATKSKKNDTLTVIIEDYDSRERADLLRDDLRAFFEEAARKRGNAT